MEQRQFIKEQLAMIIISLLEQKMIKRDREMTVE
jgi:hypothetical protein